MVMRNEKVRVQRALHHLGWILKALNPAFTFKRNLSKAELAAADNPLFVTYPAT
jgi:hypothetical protein